MPTQPNPPLVFASASASVMNDLAAAKGEWSKRLLQGGGPHAGGAVGGVAAAGMVRRVAGAVSPRPEHNVVGVGVGEKIVDGRPTGVAAVKFFVRAKYPPGEIESGAAIPRSIGGLPTDVEESGVFRKVLQRPRRAAAPRTASRGAAAQPALMPNPRTRMRPARPGCSVGFRAPGDAFVMAGTFGAVVKKGKSLFILSNNHVLADEDRLALASPIYQPGFLDGGTLADQIAELTKFVPLSNGKVDCAIARVRNKADVLRDVLHIGAPGAVGAAAFDMAVHKFGRTTSYTVGRVVSINTDVTVQYDTGNFFFQDQIIIVGRNNRPFSKAGDSGSLILERGTNRAVGLLFAGSSSHTIANHLRDVLAALGVRLA